MIQQRNTPLGWVPVAPYVPLRNDFDFDLFINSTVLGQPGPQGPQGLPGFIKNASVKLVDEPDYTALVEDSFLGIIYSGKTTITLPLSSDGKIYVVKDSIGTSSKNAISILAIDSTIDSLKTYSVDIDWGSVTLIYNGLEWNILYSSSKEVKHNTN
jgi:hypothetical protein